MQVKEDKRCEADQGHGRIRAENEDAVPLLNFFSIFRVWYFQASFKHPLSVMNLFKQYPNHTKSQNYFKKFKEVENGEGMKNVRISHILHSLSNFLVFLEFDIFVHHLNTH